ncbi:hypothetical protein ACFYOA_18380 [Streptomyces iakyrus]|uniref:hypothetical protein n=1 Tax=Streptomyces iakyrus TaxID=68219 RepID=UPI0036C4C88E
MMQSTVAAVPRRLTVLFSKAAVLSGVIVAAGAVAVVGSLLIGGMVQPGRGFTEAHGYEAMSLADSVTLRAAAGSVLYLALIGLLSLGIALIVRSSATAIGIVLGLLFLFPILTQVITDPDWQRLLQQIAPMTAGLSVQTTIGIDRLPIGPWEGSRRGGPVGHRRVGRRRRDAPPARRISAPGHPLIPRDRRFSVLGLRGGPQRHRALLDAAGLAACSIFAQ